MRLLFLILLLANITAFAYIRYAESRGGADAEFPLLQISPEKLKLLRPQARAQASLACLEWSGFVAEDMPRAVAALAGLELGDKLAQRDDGPDVYWVYIPPHKTEAEAGRKAAEVRALGISDVYVVPDKDPLRFAVVLAEFKTEQAASAYLEQIRQKGVRSAVAGPRGAKRTAFVIRDPGDSVAAKIAALQLDFPATVLKAGACPDARQAIRN